MPSETTQTAGTGLLENRVAVVTGAGRGVGSAVAQAFAAEGAKLCLAARSGDELTHIQDRIHQMGGVAIAVPTDVTSQDDVDNLFKRVHQELGHVDILVNNAAILGPTGMLWELSMSSWQAVFDVNVTGLVRCSKAVLPDMIARQSGKIINVGSIAGVRDSWAEGNPEWAAYASTKAAVLRITQVVAHQVKQHGININCLGVIAHTKMWYEASMELARFRGAAHPSKLEDIPKKELVLPEENIGAFIFLASSLSDHISGEYFEANQLPDHLRQST